MAVGNPDSVVWEGFRTSDADDAHAHLSDVYMDLAVRRLSTGEGFELDSRVAHLGDTVLGRITYGGDSCLRTVSFDDPTFFVLHAGSYRTSRPGDECGAALGGSLLLTPDRTLDLIVDHCRISTVTIPRALIESIAGGRLRFLSGAPLNTELERQWTSTVAYVQRTILGVPGVAANPLIVGQAQRVLATHALVTFPSTTAAHDVPRSGGVGPAVVERALAFIDDHLAEDMSLADVAGAARVDVLTLEAAFRARLDTTVAAHIRRARLDMAHRDLRQAPCGSPETVAVIARRWGFADVRQFSADYLGVYGRLPSETLRS